MERFQMFGIEEAAQKFNLEELKGWYDGDCKDCILDFKDPNHPVVVGTDGGEPEDKILCRDYSWVCGALNSVANESNDV